MENLAKAIIKVMKAVKGMEKNSQVGSGSYGYKGTKYQDVAEVFNDAMCEAGLCIMPIEIEETNQIDRWQEGTKMKQSVFTDVSAKYLLLHESGESQIIAGLGHGVDAQDKGAGKATTYALKNALLYTFLTPVGKMDDSDTTHSNDIATPSAKTTPPSKPKDDVKWITDKQFASLKELIKTDKAKAKLSFAAMSKPPYKLKGMWKAELEKLLA